MDKIAPYYRPGSRLTLRLNTGDVVATVVNPFIPFTMSQVILARIEKTQSDPESPFLAIVKVYDPRFLEHRIASKSRPARPWTYHFEEAAVRQTTPDPHFEFAPGPCEDDRVGWEIWYYQQMENFFRNESESYKRLACLQTAGIPRCLATGTLILTDRPYSPHVLLLQYIPDAISLKDIDSDPQLVKSISPHLLRTLIKTVSSFGALGVTHSDINLGNIIFSPRNHPNRAVVIDFGHSYFREDESDGEWDGIVHEQGDVRCLMRRLKRKLQSQLEESQL